MADQQLIDHWWAQLCAELDVDAPATPDVVLDLAATAAHEVVRPAAPLTTFLVGYAAGLAGGGEDAVERARAVAHLLAQRHGESA
ncbi:DUF6457 domain-containing protein [Aeromicrobium sp. CF4.19]|uniref:DUF6457 domain-containing protein n=1 Tax=Aeromicrobium sp. CF4.19 TaxID=3373082 RepID=UPI003EE6EA6F